MPIANAFLNPIRRINGWLEGFADSRYSAFALFICGAMEASVFPLSPDILLIALGIARPRKSITYSMLVVAGSSAGALLGYYIGQAFYDTVGSGIVDFLRVGDQFQSILREYRLNAWLVLFLAGFVPIPFMVFTIAAGFNGSVDPATLFFGALCGRLIRFLPIGVLLSMLGPKVKYYLDRYLGRTMLAVSVGLILFFIISWTVF
ncbi:MAG: phoA [Bacteroidetes bacterium]|nr:phoA [Bacteroidota bacterium]